MRFIVIFRELSGYAFYLNSVLNLINMKIATSHIRLVFLVMASFIFLFTTSCTQDTSEETLYEQDAKRRNDRIQKPVVERMDITIEQDNG